MISPLVTYTKRSPNCSQRDADIDHVVIHCVVGQCSVERLGALFADKNRGGSSNYGIGYDGRIACYVSEGYRSWCTGDSEWNLPGHPWKVNGVTGSDIDNRAITIEVASDTFHPYKITEAAYNSLINLLVDICQRYPKINRLKWQGSKDYVGVTQYQNIAVHRWFANKACPGDYIYNKIPQIVTDVNKILDELDKPVETVDVFAEAKKYCVDKGIFIGDGAGDFRWKDYMTRQELAMVLYRILKE